MNIHHEDETWDEPNEIYRADPALPFFIIAYLLAAICLGCIGLQIYYHFNHGY